MTAFAALELDCVSIHYGSARAVQGITLAVERGEIVALLGPNGSGKSSTLLAAAGVLDPRSGTVRADGIDRRADPASFARAVGLVPQEPALYDELTAAANLTLFGRMFGLRGSTLHRRVDRALSFARLLDRAEDRVRTFSGGMKQRLNLGVALLHEPAVLLLDEPTAALDPASRDALFATLHDLRDAGHAVLLTTHHIDEAEYGCDRLAVLEKGKLIAAGSPAELIRAPLDQAVLYGHLRDPLPRFFVRGLKARLPEGVTIEVVGRRLRLSAPAHDQLGQALALVLADGIVLTTFRTPPGRLETLVRGCHLAERTSNRGHSLRE
jgi:ABC-2 type transport system ATP-binding protein